MIYDQLTESNSPGDFRKKKPVFYLPNQTISTCMIACPIHQNIRDWMWSLQKGKIKEAANKLLEHNPLPSSVSRVCPIFCERGCIFLRKDFDEPLAINFTERYLGDWMLGKTYTRKMPPVTRGRVAVVGSGPAGLTCAYQLRRLGFAVTVFERLAEPGGLLIYGIPEEKLPKDIVRREIALHLRGVDFQTNTEINRENWQNLSKDFQAIVWASGLYGSRSSKVPNENHDQVMPALKFLEKAAGKTIVDLSGKRVVVVGGGNTAVDAALTAKKLGAETYVIFRRRVRAFEKDVKEAEEKGVIFWGPYPFKKIEPIVNRNLLMAYFDRLFIETNLVITALGQEPEFAKLPEHFDQNGAFVAGDLAHYQLSGSKTAAHAIASGDETARKVAAFLEKRKYSRGKPKQKIGREYIDLEHFTPKPRSEKLPEEAKRCFNCGLCTLCLECLEHCPDIAIEEKKKKLTINYQYCKGCLICQKVCPRGAIFSVEEE